MIRSRPGSRTIVAAAALSLAFSLPLFAADSVRPGGLLRGYWRAHSEAVTSEPITFSFHREEVGVGRISTQLGPDGARYVGTYVRLTGQRPLSSIRVYYTYWVSDSFDAYRYGPGGAELHRTTLTIEQFQRRYSGSVVAKLISSDARGMRCLFELVDADRGLAGGATGRCQLSDGGVIDLARID